MASPFSGGAGRRAATWQAGMLGDAQADINKLIDRNQTRSLKDLGTGYKTATGAYNDAIDLYDPYVETGGRAFDRYADATGVNGQEGYDRSTDNFRAGPGYEWMVDQGTDAVARKASALGALGSGNTMTAIADYSSHVADQEYDDYLDRLDGVAKIGYDATGKQAGITVGLGDLATGYGQDKAGVRHGYTGLGVNSRQNTAGAISEAGKGGMLAGQNAAANRMNFAMQAAKTATDLGGKLFGGA